MRKNDEKEREWIAAGGEGSLLYEVLCGPGLALETWMGKHDEISDDSRCRDD